MVRIHQEAELDKVAKITLAGFMGQGKQEEREKSPTLDEPEELNEVTAAEVEAALDAEAILLEETPLPRVPKQERERRESS